MWECCQTPNLDGNEIHYTLAYSRLSAPRVFLNPYCDYSLDWRKLSLIPGHPPAKTREFHQLMYSISIGYIV